MKKIHIFSILLSVILFAACSKGDDDLLGDNNYNADGLPNNIPNNTIIYKTTDNIIVRFNNSDVFNGAQIVTNTYSTTDGYCTITFSSEVTAIEERAFYNKKTLKSIVIPNSVESIREDAFSGCKELTSITIPNSVKSIGEYAFKNCRKLINVTIGSGLTEIGYYAFSSCTDLNSITIPNSVTFIGSCAFEYCIDLVEVYVEAAIPPFTGYYFFRGCDALSKIYVPTESVDAYKAVSDWNRHEDIITGYDF